jgi:hypothetical protein
MLRPARFEGIDTLMHFLKRVYLIIRQFIFNYDDPVDIAVFVKATDGERALQIGAGKVIAKNLLNAIYKNL